MALPENWELHQHYPESGITVAVIDDGVWIENRFKQDDPVIVSWEEIDALRELIEAVPAVKLRRAK